VAPNCHTGAIGSIYNIIILFSIVRRSGVVNAVWRGIFGGKGRGWGCQLKAEQNVEVPYHIQFIGKI